MFSENEPNCGKCPTGRDVEESLKFLDRDPNDFQHLVISVSKRYITGKILTKIMSVVFM